MINLDRILEGVRTVGIAGHIRPDGDAYGSCMGLYLFLKRFYPGIRTEFFLEASYPDSFRFISCSDEVISDYPEREEKDVFFSLDCSDRERLGNALTYFDNAKVTVVVDHHISNPAFGMINEIQPAASSTSELIALMIGKERLTKEIAEALYMGIVHDTGIFRFSCTSSRTMMVAGWLMDTGIDFTKITDDTFFRVSYHENQILGRALLESILVLDRRVIVSTVRRKQMDFYQVTPKDLSGIIQQLRVTEGVEAALFLYESGNQEYKVSMRSNGRLDVAAIAGYFGGGGHRLAAGCTMQGTEHDVMNNIIRKMDEQLRELNARAGEDPVSAGSAPSGRKPDLHSGEEPICSPES